MGEYFDMKKLLSLLVLLVLACSLALPALASGTGASPEEIARYTGEARIAPQQMGASAEAKSLYSMTGVAAASGMPAFAKDKMGAVAGAQFAAVAAAAAQSGGNVAEAVQALVDSGMTPADAISFVLTQVLAGWGENPAGEISYGYIYKNEYAYTLSSHKTAKIYQHFNTTSNVFYVTDVEEGSGSWADSMGFAPDEWRENMKFWLTLEAEDGTVLAKSTPVLLEKPANAED